MYRGKSNKINTKEEDKESSQSVMTSLLPLLFANRQPKVLETISLEELDTFLPFMILCSLGRDVEKTSEEMAIEINNCPTPVWWPDDIEFRFPLVDENRHTIMKSLICRCYTYYDCEYILKFSASLAESPPGSLTYVYSNDGKSIKINNADGIMLVKCRKENLHYDDRGNLPTPKRVASNKHYDDRGILPTPKRVASNKRLLHPKNDRNATPKTYSSSDEETEVSFKPDQSGPSTSKRKRVERGDEQPAKRQARRFQDFVREDPEPEIIHQEYFLSKFGMIPKNKETIKEPVNHKINRKKRLAHSFSVMSVTSQRGQELLVRNKHSFNLESCLERIEYYCNTSDLQEGEANQVCTRSSVQFSAMLKQGENNKEAATKEDKQMDVDGAENVQSPQNSFCHLYKWPLRSRCARIVHVGPSIKPCSVALTLLSEENILYWTKRKRSVSTMTPTGWSGSKTSICSCQRIPLIILDDDDDDDTHIKYKSKSSSTRCTCVPSKRQISTAIQSLLEVMPINSQSISKARHRNNSETLSHSSGIVASNVSRSGPASTRSVSHSFSRNKEGLGVMSYSVQAFHQGKQSLNFKRFLHRRPLAVVPSTPVVMDKEAPDICRVSSCLPVHTSSMKINFYRSILDAVKWYTKDDSITEAVDILQGSFFEDEIMASGFDRSQENIRPLTELSLPNSNKQPDYFKMNINNTERDHCFKKSSTSTSTLVTRRGERLYANREPCAFCFQGRDNFCVYEFIRQAKLAGISLKIRQKQLQQMFFKFIQAENQKS